MRTNKFIIPLSAPGGCNDTKVSDEKWLRFDCNNPISQILTPALSDIFVPGNSLSLPLIGSRVVNSASDVTCECPVFHDIVIVCPRLILLRWGLYIEHWYSETQDGTWSCRVGPRGNVITTVSINWQEKHSELIITPITTNYCVKSFKES